MDEIETLEAIYGDNINVTKPDDSTCIVSKVCSGRSIGNKSMITLNVKICQSGIEKIWVSNSCCINDNGESLMNLLKSKWSQGTEISVFELFEHCCELLDCCDSAECQICAGCNETATNFMVRSSCGHVYHFNCVTYWASIAFEWLENSKQARDIKESIESEVRSLEGDIRTIEQEIARRREEQALLENRLTELHQLLSTHESNQQLASSKSGSRKGKAADETEEFDSAECQANILATERNLVTVTEKIERLCQNKLADATRALAACKARSSRKLQRWDAEKRFPCPMCRHLLSSTEIMSENPKRFQEQVQWFLSHSAKPTVSAREGIAGTVFQTQGHKPQEEEPAVECDEEIRSLVGLSRGGSESVCGLPADVLLRVREVQRRQEEIKRKLKSNGGGLGGDTTPPPVTAANPRPRSRKR